jgi:hypothetical protein
MNTRDNRLIFEKYTPKTLEEGMFDRLKARGAGAVGTVKGLGQQAIGAVKGAVAGVKGDVAGVQAAQQQRQAGAVQGDIAKVENYRATANEKLTKLAQEIFADIGKLGIDVKKVSPNSMNVFTKNLDNAFAALIEELKQPAAQNPVTQPKSNVASSTGMSGAGAGGVTGGFTKPGTTTPHNK